MVRNAEIGILHSLYNQAPKKVILYEKQYRINILHSVLLMPSVFLPSPYRKKFHNVRKQAVQRQADFNLNFREVSRLFRWRDD
jgi:hypothetical protein